MLKYEEFIKELDHSVKTFDYSFFEAKRKEYSLIYYSKELVELFYKALIENKTKIEIYFIFAEQTGVQKTTIRDLLNKFIDSEKDVKITFVKILADSSLDFKQSKIFKNFFCRDKALLKKIGYQKIQNIPNQNFRFFLFHSVIQISQRERFKIKTEDLYSFIPDFYKYLIANIFDLYMDYENTEQIVEHINNTYKENDYFIDKDLCFILDEFLSLFNSSPVLSNQKLIEVVNKKYKIEYENFFSNPKIISLYLDDTYHEDYFKRKILEGVNQKNNNSFKEMIEYSSVFKNNTIKLKYTLQSYKEIYHKMKFLKDIGVYDFFDFRIGYYGDIYDINKGLLKKSDFEKNEFKNIGNIKDIIKIIENSYQDKILDYYNNEDTFFKLNEIEKELIELELKI